MTFHVFFCVFKLNMTTDDNKKVMKSNSLTKCCIIFRLSTIFNSFLFKVTRNIYRYFYLKKLIMAWVMLFQQLQSAAHNTSNSSP